MSAPRSRPALSRGSWPSLQLLSSSGVGPALEVRDQTFSLLTLILLQSYNVKCVLQMSQEVKYLKPWQNTLWKLRYHPLSVSFLVVLLLGSFARAMGTCCPVSAWPFPPKVTSPTSHFVTLHSPDSIYTPANNSLLSDRASQGALKF